MHSRSLESRTDVSHRVPLPPVSDAHAGASALCAAPGLAQCLWQSFAEMSDLERRIWIACMWRGESFAVVARQQGLAPSDIRQQLRATAQAMDTRLALADGGLTACLAHDLPAAQRQLFGAAVERQIRRLAHGRPRPGSRMESRTGLAA